MSRLSTIPSKKASLKLSKNENKVESTFVKLINCWILEIGLGLYVWIVPLAFDVLPDIISPTWNLELDVINNLLPSSTSSTKTFPVAFDDWPVTVSPTKNLTSESSKTIWSPFSSNTKLTDDDSCLK